MNNTIEKTPETPAAPKGWHPLYVAWCANAAYNASKGPDDPPFASASREVKSAKMKEAMAVLGMVEKGFVLAVRPREEDDR